MRYGKTVSGTVTRFVWDGGYIIAEMNGSNAVISRYVRGINLIKNDVNIYYLHNGHGDIVQLIDNNGNSIMSYQYDSFGLLVGSSNSDANPWRYQKEYQFIVSAYINNITENNLPEVIRYTPTWIDPQFYVRVSPVRNAESKIALTVMANEISWGQIFWYTDDSHPTEEKSIVFLISQGTHTYDLNLGKISFDILRFDIGVENSPVTVSNIQLRTEDTNLFRYTGEYYDLETNTYMLRFRNYDPRTSRFTREDPIRHGLNYYTYCGNNPIMFFDPWGLKPVDVVEHAKSMGATTVNNKEGHVLVLFYDTKQQRMITQTYKIGSIDDAEMNNKFGWSNNSSTSNAINAKSVQEAYQNSPRGGDFDGTYGLQCLDLVNWYINEYTKLISTTGHGYKKAGNVADENKLTLSPYPQGLSVFSVEP
jgi:RHS repeat-associated protein